MQVIKGPLQIPFQKRKIKAAKSDYSWIENSIKGHWSVSFLLSQMNTFFGLGRRCLEFQSFERFQQN
jgi:hypothetical protein